MGATEPDTDTDGGGSDRGGPDAGADRPDPEAAGGEERAGRHADAAHPPSLPPGQLYRLAWGFYLLLAVGAVVWIGWREKVIPLELFVDPALWWIDLAAGAGAGLLLVALWRLAVRGLPLARKLEGRLGALLGTLTRSEVIALAVLSGVAEELFFRGAVQGSWGFAWATVLFALMHTGPSPAFRLWTLFALIAGALFGGLMLWRGNLLAPVTAHFVVNAVNLRRVAARRPSAATD